MALLTKAMAAVKHPTVRPKGPYVATDRRLDDDDLYKSGCALVHEQAHMLIRMCQACGLNQPEYVHLLYKDKASGHTIAGLRRRPLDHDRLQLPGGLSGPDGKLMSAAQCHDPQNHDLIYKVYPNNRTQGKSPPSSDARNWAVRRKRPPSSVMRTEALARYLSGLDSFGVINHPLPAPQFQAKRVNIPRAQDVVIKEAV